MTMGHCLSLTILIWFCRDLKASKTHDAGRLRSADNPDLGACNLRARETHIRYLRVQWRMGRWGETEPSPIAGFYVAAEELKYQTVVLTNPSI
jgi:hypothetical protein